MPKYRKLPVVIQAVRWTGDINSCRDELAEMGLVFHEGMVTRLDKGIEVHTLEGTMLCNVGDWIIRGVKSELYPCKDDIFATTYEKVEG